MDIYNFIIQLAAGFISTLAFSFLFNAPKKSILVCSVIGAAGWLAYYYVKLISGIIIASFSGAIIIGVLASSASKKLRMPATIFIYTGIIPLVPGYGMYHTMRSLVTKSYHLAAKIGIDTILQAGAIAVGILIASMFSSSIRRVKIQRKR
ncbi:MULTISPECIES: threonine/serine exporter family protein [Gemella]|uniref:threonine/serine exporter family protein n=1 Tax=Gemella TaxID=1378 RepID=UPI00093071A1|nr:MULTISPECIES: threonine/serine exporter family protein [Gemella]AXI26705.1 threonine/serine exporter [Gemella sp. ND 6198]